MSIYHWIVLLAAIAAIVFLVRKANRRVDPDAQPGLPVWLAILIVGLVFLGPLVGAGRLASDFATAEHQYPQLLTTALWITYKQWAWVAFGCSCMLSIAAGVQLLRSRERSAVNFTVLTLWVAGPGLAVFSLMVLPWLVFGRVAYAEAIGGLAGSVVVAAIWTTYLLISKRVKARYSRQKGTSSTAPMRSVGSDPKELA